VTMLAKLMCMRHGPQFIVLDNLQSTSELRRLIPMNTAATVVATCREIGDGEPSGCLHVTVGTMETDEAMRLAVLLQPSLDNESSQFIAVALDCYPLIISALCGLANATGTDVEQLCRSLTTKPGWIKTATGEKLRDVVERTVRALRTNDALAVTLLACVVSSSDLTCGIDAMYAFVDECYDGQFTTAEAAGFLKKLRDVSLVNIGRPFENDKTYPEAVRSLIDSFDNIVSVTHPLIGTILLDVLAEDIKQVDTMLCVNLERLLKILRLVVSQTEGRFHPPSTAASLS